MFFFDTVESRQIFSPSFPRRREFRKPGCPLRGHDESRFCRLSVSMLKCLFFKDLGKSRKILGNPCS
ncbi:hypothetical protein AUK22_04295 [bacterium CG2_30_54_10]|nr:MAG: hypothetical protein AUK22_04295 [bacterium CG2_30_54_10]